MHKTAVSLLVVVLTLLIAGCGSAKKSSGPAPAGSIVFARSADPEFNAGPLFVAKADGIGARQLTRPDAHVQDIDADWAPDGSFVVFARCSDAGCHIWKVGSDGAGVSPLQTCTGQSPALTCAEGSTPSYSPDGRMIAFGWAAGAVENDEIEHSEIHLMNADGTGDRALTKFPAYSGDAGGAQWSPDGKSVVYSRMNAGATQPQGGRALFIINIDGTGQRQLTPWSLGASGTPAWSPVSNLIAFRVVADEEKGVGNFFTVHPDGSGLTQVTHFSDTVISHKVAFSPDGRRIMFAKQSGGVSSLYTVGIDGAGLSKVSRSSHSDTAPDWTAKRAS